MKQQSTKLSTVFVDGNLDINISKENASKK
jgi:hypothetical protein